VTACGCYSCTFTPVENWTWWDEKRARMFERCLEAVEDAGAEFSKAAVWKVHRDIGDCFGPSEYAMMQHVTNSLAAHGLIVCVRRTSHGKCRLWRKV
jgi:hypothetical protein